MTWVCLWDTMPVVESVLLLCVLRAAKEFMLFRPSSLPRLLAILGKSKLQSFRVWLACVVPNLYLTYPSRSVLLPPPSLTSPISLYCTSLAQMTLVFLSPYVAFLIIELDACCEFGLIKIKSGCCVSGWHWSHTTRLCSSTPLHTPPSRLFPLLPPHYLFSLLVVLSRCLLLCGWESWTHPRLL